MGRRDVSITLKKLWYEVVPVAGGFTQDVGKGSMTKIKELSVVAGYLEEESLDA